MKWVYYHYFKVNYIFKYLLISKTVNKQKLFGALKIFKCVKYSRPNENCCMSYLPLPKHVQL